MPTSLYAFGSTVDDTLHYYKKMDLTQWQQCGMSHLFISHTEYLTGNLSLFFSHNIQLCKPFSLFFFGHNFYARESANAFIRQHQRLSGEYPAVPRRIISLCSCVTEWHIICEKLLLMMRRWKSLTGVKAFLIWSIVMFRAKKDSQGQA